MGYDPNDPNQGSQAPADDQANADAQAKNATNSGTFNDQIRRHPAIAAWLAQHRNGQNLSDGDKAQLFYVIRATGTDPTGLEITDDGQIRQGQYQHEGRNTLIAAAKIYGGGLLGGYVAGLLGPAASDTWDAAGNFIGPTTISGADTAAPVLEGVAAGGGATTVPVGTAATAPLPGATYDASGTVTNFSSAAPDVGTRSYADLLRYGLPVAGNVIGSLIQANASGNASAAQTKYLEDALAYEKENDLYNRGIAADKVKLEAQRYGDYQGRILPFIQNGTTANDRMAALLGLPARSGGGSGGGSYGVQGPQGVEVSPDLTARVLAAYKALGLTPTGPGTGPTDSAYYTSKYAETGGSTPANDAYWFGPSGRIATDAQKAGITPTAPAPAAPSVPTPPIVRTPGLVAVRQPDGTVISVPPDQVDRYTRTGAIAV